MLIEAVWSALTAKRWSSFEQVRRNTSLDEETLSRVLNFLMRWGFVETRNLPRLEIKRKAGACSPVEAFRLLRLVSGPKSSGSPLPRERWRLVERIACRRCGGRRLRLVGKNKVECVQCHERQWFAIEVTEPRMFLRAEG